MKALLLLTLMACALPNRAATFAHRIAPKAQCEAWGHDKDGNDVALCELDEQVFHCKAGGDAPICKLVANLRPTPPPTAPQVQPPPATAH